MVAIFIQFTPLLGVIKIPKDNTITNIVKEICDILTGTQVVLEDFRLHKQQNIIFSVNEPVHEKGKRCNIVTT